MSTEDRMVKFFLRIFVNLMFIQHCLESLHIIASMRNKLRENLSTIFVQITLPNCADFPASWPVKVRQKSWTKIVFSPTKKVVSCMNFDVGQLATVMT